MQPSCRTQPGRSNSISVTFRYAGGNTNAVHDIQPAIKPGKTYALVGASGAGKSTILSLHPSPL